MNKSIYDKLNCVFFLVAGVAFAGVAFVVTALIKALPFDYKHALFVFLIVVAPMILEACGAFGLILRWFDKGYLRPGRIIEILQFIAAVFGAAAIFDGVMRFTRRIVMPDNLYWFSLDAIFLTLFVLWMVVSYMVNHHADTHGKCEFC